MITTLKQKFTLSHEQLVEALQTFGPHGVTLHELAQFLNSPQTIVQARVMTLQANGSIRSDVRNCFCDSCDGKNKREVYLWKRKNGTKNNG